MSDKIRVAVKDVRRSETPPPDTPTLKYLGHDKHAEKILTGKFGSNVAPRRSGQGQQHPDGYVCVECGHENRYYHATCFKCNQRTRPW